MKRIVFVISALLLMTFTLTSCGKAKEKLVVGVMSDIDSIPFIVAKQQGYYDENVELQIFKSPVDRDSALYSNNLDGTISDVLAVCLAKDSEFEVQITSMTQGKYGLIASAGSGIQSAAQMSGKSVGLSINTIIEYVTDSILEQENIDISTVEKVAVPKMPSRLELLANDQIDAIAVPEPYVSAAVAAGGTLLQTSTELNINPGIMLFTKNATDKKPDEIKAFYQAYNLAVDFINNNPKDKYMNEVIQEAGLPETAYDLELPQYTHYTLPEEREVLMAMDWLIKKDMIKNNYTYDELIWKVK